MGKITKCLISDKALITIAKMHSALGNTEWCGCALYYPNDRIGSVLIADVIPQAVGDPAYTKVEGTDAILPSWTMELDFSQGFIHSHHVMGTSPSGTDIEQVNSMAVYCDNYLSLIVNHHGKYTCLWTDRTEDGGFTISKLEVSMEFPIAVPKYVSDNRVKSFKLSGGFDYDVDSVLTLTRTKTKPCDLEFSMTDYITDMRDRLHKPHRQLSLFDDDIELPTIDWHGNNIRDRKIVAMLYKGLL